jgi:hypothetical protein
VDSNGVVDTSAENTEQRCIPKSNSQEENEEKQKGGISSIGSDQLPLGTIPEGEKYDEEHLAR